MRQSSLHGLEIPNEMNPRGGITVMTLDFLLTLPVIFNYD